MAETFQTRVRINRTGTSNTTITLNAQSGNITAGNHGTDGDVLLQDNSGTRRVHLDAGGQRLELRNSSGQRIGMIGGAANMRLGTNGQNGNVYLYPPSATNIFSNGQARVQLSASGNVALRDSSGTNRVHLSAGGQRMELRNTSGQRIGMIGGAANLRLGTNGEGGDVYLYPSSATNIFSNGQATIHLNANSGDIILRNADCAEDFDLADDEELGPGTVVVIAKDGKVRTSRKAYDRCVAGVMSGAGPYKPGLVLDRRAERPNRKPVALVGKVQCCVDARYGPIDVGDLLTTSDTAGHAMRASDPLKAFGAVIGKALGTLPTGQGLVPVLVALQ